MKLTAVVKLLPNADQYAMLRETLERANAACNWISEQAWEHKAFGQSSLHELTYYTAREQFGLGAQIVARCIGKVLDAYKLDKARKRGFKPHGAIAYDSRILNWRLPVSNVSIWTLGGRIIVPFVAGATHFELLKFQQGESDLVFRNDKWYVYTTCDVPDDAPIDPESWLGIDVGVVNIAADSDGEVFTSRAVNNVRYRHRRLRAKLQKKGTRSAKRRLKQLSGKEARFSAHTNHCISKYIVAKAQGTQRGIALENLTGIRKRITARKPQRATLHRWAFADLQAKIAYKAQRVGVSVRFVDPRNTSRTCPSCGISIMPTVLTKVRSPVYRAASLGLLIPSRRETFPAGLP